MHITVRQMSVVRIVSIDEMVCICDIESCPLSDILLEQTTRKSWSKNINFKTVYNTVAKPIKHVYVFKHLITV